MEDEEPIQCSKGGGEAFEWKLDFMFQRNSIPFQEHKTRWNGLLSNREHIEFLFHPIRRNRAVLQPSKRHCCSPRQYCPLPESHHTHMDPIDGLSSVDHDELAQRTLVLVACDDAVVYASSSNPNGNGLVGYSGNGLEKSYELE